jgi:hypothetical protein
MMAQEDRIGGRARGRMEWNNDRALCAGGGGELVMDDEAKEALGCGGALLAFGWYLYAALASQPAVSVSSVRGSATTTTTTTLLSSRPNAR